MKSVVAAFVVEIESLKFPNVYGPRQNFNYKNGPDTFSITVLTECLPAEIAESLYGAPNDEFVARSGVRPRVVERAGRYAEMVSIFAELEVRNIPRDHALRGTSARATLSVREFEMGGRRGNMLALHSVTVDVGQMQAIVAAWTKQEAA